MMEESNTEIPLQSIDEKIALIHDNCRRGSHGYTVAVKECAAIIEQVMKMLIQRHLHQLSEQAHLNFLKVQQGLGKGTKTYRNFTMGELSRLIREAEFFEELSKAIGADVDAVQRMDVNKLLTFRNKATHNDHQASAEEANLVYSVMAVYLKLLGIECPPMPALRLDGVKHNLKIERGLFVGREEEIEQIHAFLEEKCLVTLTGSGGCGKTTLMTHVARQMLDDFPDGVWLIELVSLTTAEAISKEILKVLKVREKSDAEPLDVLLNHLRTQKLLLLLDNCEHLVKPVTRLISRILNECQDVKLLATTRIATGIKWGQQLEILPFATLDMENLPLLENALDNASLRLFQYSKSQQMPGFQITEDNLETVAYLCNRLCGIPLAIELAACMRSPLKTLADNMEAKWKTAPDDIDEAEERHDTMQQCILWSHNMLRSEEQVLFRRLSLFAGGWTLELCKSVCVLQDLEEDRIYDILNALSMSSLILNDEQTERYRFLEPILAFAERQLELSGEKNEIKERFKASLLPMLEIEDFTHIGSADGAKVQRALDETTNVEKLVALDVKNNQLNAFDIELSAIIYRYAEGTFRVMRKRLNPFKLVEGRMSAPKQLKYYTAMAVISFMESNYEEVIEHAEKGLTAATLCGNRKYMALAHSGVGCSSAFIGNPDAEMRVRRGLEIAEEIEDSWAIAFAQMCRGSWMWEVQGNEFALPAFEIALANFQKCQDTNMMALTLNSLAHVTRQTGEVQKAALYYQKSLSLCFGGKLKSPRGIVGCIMGAGGIAFSLGRYGQATEFWSSSEKQYAKQGAKLLPPIQKDFDREMTEIKQRLGKSHEAFCNYGARLSLNDAASLAQRFFDEVALTADEAQANSFGSALDSRAG